MTTNANVIETISNDEDIAWITKNGEGFGVTLQNIEDYGFAGFTNVFATVDAAREYARTVLEI